MNTPTSCPFCEKKGLPILPLRYAVARADIPHAPKLQGSFGQGVKDIPLPEKEAHYTLRLLRGGYLYVFDERRGEWTAYVVTNEGYLFGFDPDDKHPPTVHDTKFACKRAGDAHIARCVTVKDAKHATKVWLGFSDAPWTPAVLEKHAKQAWREAHMTKFDVAAWRGGSQQSHADSIDKVGSLVAEYATEQSFVVTQINHLSGRFSSAARKVRAAMAKVSPWSYSPQEFTGMKSQTDDLARWAVETAEPFKPAMVALSDAAGITMELNNLAIQRALEWMEEPKRKWSHATAITIAGIRQAVLAGAVKEQIHKQVVGANAISPMQARFPVLYGPTPEEHRAALEKAETITHAKMREVGEEAWSKYSDMLKGNDAEDEKAWHDYLDQYGQQFASMEKSVVKPLDDAYLAWLKSDPFKAHFTHNFDPLNIQSGMAYQALAHACVREASGRKAVSDYLRACLGEDPTKPEAVLLRGFMFNQDTLAVAWNTAATKTDAGSDAAWWGAADQLYQSMKEVIGAESGAQFQGAAAGLSKYMRQFSGPIMDRLTAAAQHGTKLALAALPEQRQLSLMQTMLRQTHDNKKLMLVDLRGVQTRKEAAGTLADYISDFSGGSPRSWKRSAYAMLRDVDPHKSYTWRGLFVVDEGTLEEALGMKGQKRVASVRGATEATQFDVLMESNARFIASKAVVAGGIGLIITGISLYFSYGELAKDEGKDHADLGWSFAGGAIAAVGEVGELGGVLLSKTAWGSGASALAERVAMGRFASLGELVEGAGKLLGVVGGVIVGVVQIAQGIRAINKGDAVFGWGMLMVGAGGIAVGVMLWLSVITGGIALILFLMLAIAGYIVSLFKHDDLQHWLDSCYFGKHELDGEKYSGLSEQHAAYAALMAEH